MFDFLTYKFSTIFRQLTGKHKLSEANIAQAVDKMKDALIDADVPLPVVEKFIQEIKEEVIGKKIALCLNASEQFMKLVHEKITVFLHGKQQDFSLKSPATVMVMGLQGSGKTTSCAKLAYFIKNTLYAHKKISLLTASVDFYRPAAVEQLKLMSQKAGIDFFKASSVDPLQAAQEIKQYMQQHFYDVLLLDTAGRLHVENVLLQELIALESIVQPTHTLLVLDGMTGQQSLNIAQAFDQAVPFHGAMLTKMDSNTRAGAAFAFRYYLKKPIWFLGSGEKVEDLETFKADRIASRMIGMGDLQTLVEKAEQKISKQEQEKAQKSLMSSKGMNLQDFLVQLEMMNRMGSISSLMRYMPGLGGKQLSQEQIEKTEQDTKKFRAIIYAMTPKERENYKLLNLSCKKRIERGAGVTLKDIDNLIQRFEEMLQFAKLMKNMGNFSKLFK